MAKWYTKEYKRDYMRKYNATEKGANYNRAHTASWRKKNKRKPEKRKQSSASYRDIIVDFLIKRDGYICGFCQKSLEGYKVNIDHLVPVAFGGKDIMENVRLAHESCNLGQISQIKRKLSGY